MASTGATAPTAAQTVSESPWLDDTWVNPNNIFGAGEASVTAATFDAGDQTYVLKAYTFDFSAIPDGAQIDGVECVVNARYATAPASIDLMQLLDISRAKVGTNQCATPVALTTSAANYTKGGATDNWGNALTSAWVKDADFGVAVGCLAGGSGNNNVDVYIDSVTLNIYYTVVTTINLSSGVVSAGGQALTLQPGAVIKALAAAAIAALGQTITISAPLPAVLINLAAGLLSASGQAIDQQSGAVSITLNAGGLTAGGQSLTLQPGAISKTLAAALLAASGQTVTISAPAPGININLAAAGLAAGGQSLTLQPGAVSITLDAAALAGIGQVLVLQPGAFSLTLDAAALLAGGQTITIDSLSGAVQVSLAAALLAASGQSLTLQPGEVSITLDAAALAALGQALAVLGGIVIETVTVSDSAIHTASGSDAKVMAATGSDAAVMAATGGDASG